MPSLPPRPCTHPGCRNMQTKNSKCDDHQRKAWEGSTGRGGNWTRKRNRIMERDGWLCQTCHRSGKLTKATQVDHIKPKFEGGNDNDENLEAICFSCHALKTAQESHRGRQRRGR